MPTSNSSGDSSDSTEATLADLLWAIQSPLLCGNAPPHYEQWAQEPLGEGILSKEIASHRRVPIGRYFERLVQDWLGTREGVSKLAANLPLRSDGATLGEVDLVFEVEDRCFHWELAIKFYLGTGDRLETRNWFGPGGRDRLDLKLEKMESHQLRLLQRKEAVALLKEHGLANPESHALIKGYLFHPFADWAKGHRPTPACVNREHAHGWWIHQSDWAAISQRSRQWKWLEKREWLSPAKGTGAIQAKDLGSWLNNYFDADDRPPMLVAMTDDGHEMERGFVVPDDWAPSPK